MSMTNRTSFQRREFACGDVQYGHSMMDGGFISVVDRMTGFGWRDIETGYRCPSGQFWLASGGYDIRDDLHTLNSEQEMAEWVMARANTCTGGNHPRRVGSSPEWLAARDNWKPAQGEGEK